MKWVTTGASVFLLAAVPPAARNAPETELHLVESPSGNRTVRKGPFARCLDSGKGGLEQLHFWRRIIDLICASMHAPPPADPAAGPKQRGHKGVTKGSEMTIDIFRLFCY